MRFLPFLPVIAGFLLFVAALPSAGQDPDLPEEMNPPALQESDSEPVEKNEPAEGQAAPERQSEAPDNPPLPTERPDRSEDPGSGPEYEPPEPKTVEQEPEEDAGQPADEEEKEVAAVMPREELECRRRLASLGVIFTEHEPLSGEAGCRVAHPIGVTELPGGVELQPEAVMNCATAEAAGKFVRDTIAPGALEVFNSPLRRIGQASAYVCRPRNGTTKLSEHAFGNALDIASFGLLDGTTIEVRRHGSSEPRRKRFLADVRKKACGPFKTVLGPGTDADHSDHFHLDLAQRRNGGTYCR
jgi:hypothetical protein